MKPKNSHSVYVQNTIEYENGGNIVHAGSGNDSIYGEGGAAQSIDGGPGRDFIRIELAASCGSVDGGLGDDAIVANGDYQSLAGGGDNDLIVVGTYGAEKSVDGGSGIDTVQLADVGGRIDLAAGVHASAGVRGNLLNFENAIGSTKAEEISRRAPATDWKAAAATIRSMARMATTAFMAETETIC